MTNPRNFLSEVVQTRIVQLLRSEKRPPTLREIVEKLDMEAVTVTVNLAELRSLREVRAFLAGDGRTRFEFAPHDDED